MPDTRLLVEIDGDALADADLSRIQDVQVEETADQADALTLVAQLEAGQDGEWTSILDPLTTPRTPVAVQVSRGDVLYRFDGLSTEASWEIDAEGSSRLTVKALDRTLELDAEEKVVAWPGSSDSDIAQSIFGSYGLSAQVDDTPDGPDPDVHVVLQRATDWAFLRALAAKWGYAVYLESDGRRITGHFHALDPLAEPQGELSAGFGGDARKLQVTARLVAGQRVKGARIPALSDSAQDGDAAGDDQAQGSRSLGGQATILLAPTDVDGEVEPLAAATGLARESAFVVRLTAEIDTAVVGLMLRARRTVLVKGLGSSLSGRYLVERVRHKVSTERHAQELTLVRNALGLRGDEPFGGAGGLLGGLL
jgi:hypothetical protein